MTNSEKNQPSLITNINYYIKLLNIYDYKVATALAVYTGYNAYKVYNSYTLAAQTRVDIDFFKSDDGRKAYKIFNSCMQEAGKKMNLEEINNLPIKFDEILKGWKDTGQLNTLKLVFNNLKNDGFFTQNFKESIFNLVKNLQDQPSYTLSIPSSETITNYLETAQMHEFYGKIGAGLFVIDGFLSSFSFSDNILYNNLVGNNTTDQNNEF
jgi:hypothetical protein